MTAERVAQTILSLALDDEIRLKGSAQISETLCCFIENRLVNHLTLSQMAECPVPERETHH